MSLEGYLEKRGAWKRWAPVALRLQNGQIHVLDLKEASKPNAQPKDVLIVDHVERLEREELGFTVHFAGGASRKGILSGGKEKWLLRASTREQYDKWMNGLIEVVREKRGQAAPSDAPAAAGAAPADYSYGLPPTDPRTDLPIAPVPDEYGEAFAFLKMAVIHWLDTVKQLGSDFGTSDMVCVLGDKCVYLCSTTADVKRCVRVADISKVLVAQDSKKELYAILVMPPQIGIDGKPDAPEFDMMFHSPDIKRFVRYLRTVYIHQTQKMLPLEQLRDKAQLETEIRLGKPEGWVLNYWQPMFKEHLAQILAMWAKSDKKEENEKFKQEVARMLDSTDCIGGPAVTEPAPQPAVEAPPKVVMHSDDAGLLGPEIESKKVVSDDEAEEDDVAEDDDGGDGDDGDDDDDADDDQPPPPGAMQDPFGRLLIAAGLAQYYTPLAVENKMTIDLLTSELIDGTDLEHWGVSNAKHRARILALAQDEEKIKAAQQPAKGPKFQDIALDDDLDLDDDDFLGAPAPAPAAASRGADASAMFDDLDLDLGMPSAAPNAGLETKEADEARARSQIVSEEAAARADLQAACTAFAPLEASCDTSTPLGRFLAAVKLPQYYDFLTSRDISLETLACGLVDDASLKLFGIDDATHRAAILKGIEDPNLVGDHALGWITEHERSPLDNIQRVEAASRKDVREAEASGRAVMVQEFTEKMPAPVDIDVSDPLGRFLKAIGLPQYYWGLSAKDMSLEVMTSDLIDDDDLKNHCDIANNADRRKLRVALKDSALVERCKNGDVPANSWSIQSAAQSHLQQAQSKITEIGGLGLTLGDDLLGGAPAAAPANPSSGAGDLLGGAPPPAPAQPAKASPADDLLGGAPSPAAPAAAPAPAGGMDDLLGGTPPPQDLKKSPINDVLGSAPPPADDLL